MTMTTKTYVRLLGERLDDDERHNYRLLGLPEGKSFADPDNYETLYASWLSVEGIGFAASDFELSQHGKTITVEQDMTGGSAKIAFAE
jgi:hypothetical protein